MVTKTLGELIRADFRRLKGVTAISFAKTENGRTMVYCYVDGKGNEATFKRLYDGKSAYVEGLLKEGFED